MKKTMKSITAVILAIALAIPLFGSVTTQAGSAWSGTVKNLVVFGDSWAAGWGVGGEYPDDPSVGWETVKVNRFTYLYASNNGYTEYNYAIGGAGFVCSDVNTSTTIPENTFDAQFVDATETGNEYSAKMTDTQISETKMVLIMGGWNDAQNCDCTYEEWNKAVLSMVSKVRNKFTNAQIVVALGQKAQSFAETNFDRDEFEQWVYDTNAEISKTYPDVDVIWNLDECLETKDEYFMWDGIHPNTEGQHLIAEWLEKQIPVSIKLKTKYLSAQAGTTENIPVTFTVFNKDWESSDTSVASVDQNGNVTINRYGNALITLNLINGGEMSCYVEGLFSDVAASGKYYCAPVYWAAEKGITTGYDRVYFGVDRNCSRRELMIFLWRLAGCPESSSYKDPYTEFSDMGGYAETTATYKAVAWGVSEGIVKGYSDGTFRPDNNITRLDTMIMIYRYAGKPSWTATRGTMSYSDMGSFNTKSDSYNSVCWAYNNRITNGYTSGEYAGMFGINLNVLRQDVVTFLYRYAK